MAKSSKFGTFGGVFVPSILTILGVIMYLRLPMIVGQAGLWATIGIIVVAHIISVTTGLSVSSIATDKKVEAGGTYYMISRSLGLSIGGTLGLALFVGLSFSVSLYLIGFSESFLGYWGWSTDINNIRFTGTIILLAVTTVTLISTSLAIKTQYFIMVAIVLSLVSIFMGDHDYAPAAVAAIPAAASTVPLMVLFGIFFPAVTGFEAGVSMSGDLKDPKKSIPGGSIMAILVGFVVYLFLTFFFYFTVDAGTLSSDSQVLLKISWIPELVIAGIWGATLSSALGSILGAPRILQATAIDKITPKFFSKGYGPSKEPRNALLLTFLIAEAGILIGELDVIARIVSIFFITTYGFLNISAAFERWSSADFRPDFKIPSWVSIVGALACILVMIQLDFVAMLGATFLLGLIYLLLKRRELTLDSGDAWSGVWASLVKKGLKHLTKDKLHKRNWRPNIIMFSGNPATREYMVEIGKAISGKLGILSAFELIKSDQKMLTKSITNLEEDEDSADYFRHKLPCRDVYEGMDQIARVYGFSGVEPNTILMGWTRQEGNQERFVQLIESFSHERFNTLFLNYHAEKGYGNYKTIDVWWSGAGRNLSLAFSIVRHLTSSLHWSNTTVRILIINEENAQSEDIYKKTTAILNEFRLHAEVQVINNEIDEKETQEIIQAESVETDLVILGIPDKRLKQLDTYFEELNGVVESIGTSLIINASTDFEDHEVIEPKKPAKQQEDLLTASLTLDEMEAFTYPELTNTLRLVDTNGQKVVDLFYFKTLHKIFQDHIEVTNTLLDRTQKIGTDLAELRDIPELLKRKKAIEKLKSDTLFKLKAVVTKELRDQVLITHHEKLKEGIRWYMQRLRADFKKYPRKLKVAFQDEAFTHNPEDAFGLASLKRWKKFKHYFVGKPITVTIPYREVARHYQLHSRLVFFDRLLTRFQQEEEIFYKNLRKTGGAITSLLEEVERKIYSEEAWDTADLLAELEQSLVLKKEELLHISTRYHNRLRVEFRRNVESMGHDMEQLQVGKRLAKRTRGSKYYDKVASSITDFSDEYLLATRTLLNMISMELAVNSTRNRQEAILEDFHTKISQSLKNNYLKKLDQVVEKLGNKKEENLGALKVELDFDAELYESVEEHLAKMIMLTEEMPESVEVYALQSAQGEEPETISIPVSRMAEYFFKSRYDTPVEDAFEQFIEALKRSVFTAQDAISLAQFNSENEKENDEMSVKEIVETCKLKLETEAKQVEEYLTAFKESSEEALDNVFDPLSSVKIQESAMDFSSGLISYQGKQVLTGAGALFGKASKSIQKLITTLSYSRSETILMSRKLDKSSQLISVNSKLLDLKDKLNPNASTIQHLPQYYVSLFSGKSNIGKDFWVKRKTEEEAFKKAVKRYKSGFGGGIMLLGDRNSGKTAFAKHITQALFKVKNVYSIFPPIAGTTSTTTFREIFAKALQQKGDLRQMVHRLPADSVIIINDLELFWERSEEGMEIVKRLEELIDELGRRVLFVVNMNPHAYRLMNQLTSLGDRFIELIPLKAFSAEEIQALILKRHKSSGLAFGYHEGAGQLNEVQMASLFNSYFNYSNGNPGTALNGWLSRIKKVNKGYIEVTRPEYPSLDNLKQLDAEWDMLLVEFILHKRLTTNKICQITGWTKSKAKAVVLAMLRAGLIIEKSSSVYHLDPFIQPFIVDALKDKELLK